MNPKAALVAKAYLELAMGSADRGDMAKATEWATLALEQDPNWVAAYDCRARYLHKQDKNVSALRDLAYALTLEPENTNILFARAVVYHSQGKLERCKETLDLGLNIDNDHIDMLEMRSEVLRNMGDLTGSILDELHADEVKEGRKVRDASPPASSPEEPVVEPEPEPEPDHHETLEAFLSQARDAMANGDVNEVKRACNEALDLTPDDVRFIVMLSYEKMSLGMILADTAMPFFERALSLEASNLDARAGCAWGFAHRGEYDRAMRDFNWVLALEPHHVQALLGRGNAQLKRGNDLEDDWLREEANKDFGEAQRWSINKRDRVNAYAGSAWTLLAQGNPFMYYYLDELAKAWPGHPHLQVLRNACQKMTDKTIQPDAPSASGSRWDGGAAYRRSGMGLTNSLFQSSMDRQHRQFLQERYERRREDYR